MPSFDIVVSADPQEIRNAVDQLKREVSTRYDLKDSGTEIELKEGEGLQIEAKDEFFIKTVADIFVGKLVKRGVDPLFFEAGQIETSPTGKAKQYQALKQGIPQDLAKKITKKIKDLKLKVQPAVRGDEIRCTGKKRDDLQEVISILKAEEFDRPLSFINFRD